MLLGSVSCLPRRIRSISTTKDWQTPAPGLSDGCKPNATRRACWKDWKGPRRSAGKKFDRVEWNKRSQDSVARIFLMNNVHEDEPVVFETRWCLSYLRGPLTRTQIKTLMEPVRRETLDVKREISGTAPPAQTSSRISSRAPRQMLSPDVPQHFVPLRGSKPEGSKLVYAPMLLGSSQIRFSDTKSGIDTTQGVTVLATITDGAVAVDWDHAAVADLCRVGSRADTGEAIPSFFRFPQAPARPRAMPIGVKISAAGYSEHKKSNCSRARARRKCPDQVSLSGIFE